MKQSPWIVVLLSPLAVIVALASSRPAVADDWPEWRGPARDGISRETGLLAAWPPEGPKVLWRRPTDEAYSSVAIADGKAYTLESRGKKEYVVCLNAATGDPVWEVLTADDFTTGTKRKRRPSSTPLIRNGRVYAAGCAGTLLCLNAKDGKGVWGYNLFTRFGGVPGDWGYSCSPLLSGDKLIVSADGAGGKAGVLALDKDSGEIVWNSLKDMPTYSSPIEIEIDHQRQIVFLLCSRVVGLALDNGKELWSYPWVNKEKANIATPVYHDGRVFISCAYELGSALVALTEDAGKWKATEVWKKPDFQNWYSNPILLGGYLYGFHLGRLTCVNFETGKERWAVGGFGKGQVMCADGRLVVFGESGVLALAKPDPEGYREISKFQAVRGAKCWAMPTVANGRMYIRGPGEIVCYDVNAGAPPAQ